MDIRRIERMVKGLRAQTMPAGNEIRDHWSEGQVNAAPSRREIGFGPRQAAWGGDAENMIRRYAHPAEQHGATATVESLSRDLDATMRDASALQRSIATLTAHTAKLASIAANQRAWPDGAPEDDDEDDAAEKAWRLRRAARAERRAQADAAKAETGRERRAAERRAAKAKRETDRLLAQQLDEMQKAVEGIAPLKTSVGEMMNFLLSRGRSGGTAPLAMRKAAGRDEVLKSVAAAMNHMGPLERSHAETIVRMKQAGVGADVIRKRLDGIGGNVAIALRPLVEIG